MKGTGHSRVWKASDSKLGSTFSSTGSNWYARRPVWPWRRKNGARSSTSWRRSCRRASSTASCRPEPAACRKRSPGSSASAERRFARRCASSRRAGSSSCARTAARSSAASRLARSETRTRCAASEGLAAEVAGTAHRAGADRTPAPGAGAVSRVAGPDANGTRNGRRRLSERDIEAWGSANDEFHQVIQDAAGNEVLVATLSHLHRSFPRGLEPARTAGEHVLAGSERRRARGGARRRSSGTTRRRHARYAATRDPCRRARHRPVRRTRGNRSEARGYSGTSQTAASGGSVRSAENGWSCQGIASASTPPRLPTPEPP